MSSSKIIRGTKDNDCSITSYDIQEMGNRDRPNRIEEARKEAREILKKAKARREAIEMEAYNEGIEKGQAEGRKMAVKKIEPLFDTLGNALDELSGLRQSIIDNHSDQILELVFLIAEKVIHRSIQLKPEIILETVQSASVHLMETDDIRLRLHPSDFEYIRDIEQILAKKLSGRQQVHVIEDTSIDRGGIIIDTEFGDIDATIRSQIDHMKDMLSEHD